MMRALTESQLEEMAKVLANPKSLPFSLCPHDIELEDDARCKGGDWETTCEDCWKAALPQLRIVKKQMPDALRANVEAEI